MSAATSEVVVAEIVKADALAPAFAGLEASSARQLREAFVPALLQIEEWERQAAELTVTDETQTAKMELAGVMRKALKKVRVGVEKKRKELGADALARTKAINCAAGIVEGLIVPLEKRLLEQETFGERAAEARRNQLGQARREALVAYGADPSVYAALGEMSDEAWSSLLDSARVVHEAKIEEAKRVEAIRVEAARLEAEARAKAKAEAVRIEAERVERERLQVEENARLQREKAEIEAAARLDREAAAEAARLAKAEADRVAAEQAEKARIEREAAAEETRKAREEADRIARELAELNAQAVAKARAEREAADAEVARIEAELAAAKAAEAARVAEEAAARQAAELAPDREKLAAFATMLRGIEVPTLTTAEGKAAAAKVAAQLAKMAAWVSATGEAL